MRSATSPTAISSSTWPTGRRGWWPTTSNTRTGSGASTTRAFPFAVFSNPQVAAVGLTEEEARHEAADGADIVVAVQDYGSTAYGWAMEDSEGIVKLIAEKSTGRLLGAHILGHEASMLIQPLIQAIALSTPVVRARAGTVLDSPGPDRGGGKRLAGAGRGLITGRGAVGPGLCRVTVQRSRAARAPMDRINSPNACSGLLSATIRAFGGCFHRFR